MTSVQVGATAVVSHPASAYFQAPVSAAPTPLAESELVSRLTDMGYKATDLTRDGVLAGLDGLASVTDGRLVNRVSSEGTKAAYEMNSAVAKQVLKSILRR